MEKCFLYGNGGSNPLNFKIVGSTSKPSNPKENWFWVNTSIQIQEHQFATTQPTKRANGTAFQTGDVWFETSKAGSISVNALKKNGIILIPVKCMQYNGSSLVQRPFQVYQNNAWKEPASSIIFNANSKIDETGGFTLTTAELSPNVTTSATKQSDGKYYFTATNNANQWFNVDGYSKNDIILSPFTTARITWSVPSEYGDPVNFNIGFASAFNSEKYNAMKAGTYTTTIDVSHLTEDKLYCQWGYGSEHQKTVSWYLISVELE